MSALQESRRELMVQLEGLMRLLKVRNSLDKNEVLHFPWHVWKQHHLFSHSILTFFLSTFFSTTSVSGVSAFTHCHLSSSGWQDEEQKQAVSVPLIQLKNSGVNTLGHSCKSLSWHMYCVCQNMDIFIKLTGRRLMGCTLLKMERITDKKNVLSSFAHPVFFLFFLPWNTKGDIRKNV